MSTSYVKQTVCTCTRLNIAPILKVITKLDVVWDKFRLVFCSNCRPVYVKVSQMLPKRFLLLCYFVYPCLTILKTALRHGALLRPITHCCQVRWMFMAVIGKCKWDMKPLTAVVLQVSAWILHWQCTELVTLCNYNSVPLFASVTVSVYS